MDLSKVLGELVDQADGTPRPLLGIPDAPVVVIGSEADLRLAISNLLGNAIRHTPATGSVTIRLIEASDHVEVVVTDTGEGIPSKHIARIFERFYRVDSARSRATGGTGLGLSIVRHVIAQHGGSVHVESVLGQGSTFTVQLPVPPAEDRPTSTPRSEHSPAHRGGRA